MKNDAHNQAMNNRNNYNNNNNNIISFRANSLICHRMRIYMLPVAQGIVGEIFVRDFNASYISRLAC